MEDWEKPRYDQLDRALPDIWKENTILYIGAHEGRIQFGDIIRENNLDIDILEIWKPNVDYLRKTVTWFNDVIEGDVRNIDKVLSKKYDIIFWWHGPEHIKKTELFMTIQKLENYANKYVVLGCPWGDYPQGEEYGNPYEVHTAAFYEEDFQAYGYKTSCVGIMDVPGSNLMAWKDVTDIKYMTPNSKITDGIGNYGYHEIILDNNIDIIKTAIEQIEQAKTPIKCHVTVISCKDDELLFINKSFIKEIICGIKFSEKVREIFPIVSILFLTYDRLEYTKKAIDCLLKSTNYPFNLYIVDNHSTDGTVNWLREIENRYPNIREIIYNGENRGLAEPTNDFWKRVDSDLVGKIDNDTLVPDGWLERLVDAHQKSKKLGVVGGWHYRPEDFNEKDAQNKIYIDNGIQIVEDTHIGGCCYLMKRSIYEKLGPMSFNPKFKIHGWTEYQNKINRVGWKIGYLYPLIQLDYMDDPRSPNCLIEKKYTEYTKKIWKERNVTYSSPEQLIALLSGDAKRVTDSKQELNMQDSNNDYFEFSRPEVQALVDLNSQTILDVGCASGIFGSQIKEKLGAEVWGIEPVEDIGIKAKKVIDKVFIGRVEDHIHQLPDEYFDSIIFSDVLEHLADPYLILDLVKDKLSKNGEIIASIPNVRHWSVLKELLEGKWEYQDAGILDRTHLRFFTKSSIIKMFQNSGYKINEIIATQFGENRISPKLLKAMSQSGLNVSSLAEEANHYQYLLKVSPLNSLQKKMDDLPLVSIIMLTWNALEYTKKCITSIQKFTHYPYEIIFVDNASTDGSVEFLRNLITGHDNYKLIENKENKGFSRGNNQGVSAASGEYVMLLNNDVLVSKDWLSRMVDSIEKHKKIGIVGPVTNHISGRQSYVGQYDGDDYEAFAQFIENENKGKLTPRRRLAGFAMLMKKNVYREVDGFDETFGIGNFEDDDMSLKVRSKGLALMVDESVFIHHYGSQTFKENRIDIVKNLNERMPIFKKKWPDVDYSDLLEINNPLDKLHSDFIDNGLNALENSDFSSAEKQFSQILKDNPISEEALYGLTLCSRNQDDSLKAFEFINELLKLNPNHSEALNQFGLIMVEQKKLSDARKAFIAAIEITPGFVEVQRNLAELYILEEDFETGVQTYLTILKNHPGDIPSLLRMAELNREANNTIEASEWAKMVLELEPEHPFANQFIS